MDKGLAFFPKIHHILSLEWEKVTTTGPSCSLFLIMVEKISQGWPNDEGNFLSEEVNMPIYQKV